MKKLSIVLLAGLAAGCLPTQTPNQIIVDGEASLEFEPDVFSLSATIRSRKQTKGEALKEIAERLATIRETAPRLEGLTHLTIDASAAEMTPIQNRKCLEEARYRTQDACPVEAHFGSIQLKLSGSPANSSGAALSLLSELGAESVELTEYTLTDIDAAQKEALVAAVENAKNKARNIAAAANSNLVGPIRIQYGDGFESDRGYYADVASPSISDVVASELSVTPDTELDLAPQPITVKAEVTAAFEIE